MLNQPLNQAPSLEQLVLFVPACDNVCNELPNNTIWKSISLTMFSHSGLNMAIKSKQVNFSNNLASFLRISILKEPAQETLAWSNNSRAFSPWWKFLTDFTTTWAAFLGVVFSQDLFVENFTSCSTFSYPASKPGHLFSGHLGSCSVLHSNVILNDLILLWQHSSSCFRFELHIHTHIFTQTLD